MTFIELQKICEKNLGIEKLADIARELNVTPQVVSNWKARDQVPYKYVKELKVLIEKEIDIDSLSKTRSNQKSHSEKKVYKDDLSVLDILTISKNLVFNNYLYFICLGVLIPFLTALYVLYISPIVFFANATILPIGNQQSLSSIQQFASRYGLASEGENNDAEFTSSTLIPSLINSRKMSRSLLKRKFFTKKYESENTLLEILTYGKGAEPDNLEPHFQYGSSLLASEIIKVSIIKGTPLFNITANSFEAKLAADIVSAVIEELKAIHLDFKLSQLNEKKIYLESRMQDILGDLTLLEDELKDFREKNRIILSSPALMLEQERLIRDLEVKNQIYITLKTQMEMANIEEVQNSKTIRVLDPPEVPINRTSPQRTKSVIISFLVSLILSFGLVFMKDIGTGLLRDVGRKKLFSDSMP